MNELPQQWANRFGLALAPLFGTKEVDNEDSHAVLLDGGNASFAMSVTAEELWLDKDPASWAWSSNLPHHVTVTDSVVAVTRWDNPRSEVLSRSSVESQIELFYEYLADNHVRSNQRVVEYVLNLFRRIRSLVAKTELQDEQSIDVFLAFLEQYIESERHLMSGDEPIAPLMTGASTDHLRMLPDDGLNSLIEELRDGTSLRPFRLYPSLAVRHAGSEIFQEAHFEFLRAPSLDLFNYIGPAESNSVTRGGAHFTPPALARCLVEQTLLQIEDLENRERLIVLDPACGSGSFLHEALRALQRHNFSGHLKLVGRDISLAAVSMANFVVTHGVMDWSSKRNIEIDVRAADSLIDPLPQADVVLMNPPFISWHSLDNFQRDQMRQVLGSLHKGQGDLSMAFVSRAVDSLAVGGAIGVLLPSSLLTLKAAEKWRDALLEKTDIRLLASLGDFSLFAYALIQVAAVVMSKSTHQDERHGTTTALVTSNSTKATGLALRTLRRDNPRPLDLGQNDAWRLFEVPTETFSLRPTWRLITPRAEAALSKLMEAGAARVSDLFDVREGLTTGDNKAFILNKNDYESLPVNEKVYFKPAVMNQSIQNGQLQSLYWVFYPYDINGPCFNVEDDLLEEVPEYAKRFLFPRRERLLSRSSHTSANRNDWWGLSRSRETWAFDTSPRLVSKHFGGPGGFAVDLGPSFLVVKGFVWFLKDGQQAEEMEEPEMTLPVHDLLCAYMGILNAPCFGKVLDLFSQHVAGGQYDLSRKYIDHIPIPNLADLARDERMGHFISRLVVLGREPRLTEVRWNRLADQFTTELYGEEFFERI